MLFLRIQPWKCIRTSYMFCLTVEDFVEWHHRKFCNLFVAVWMDEEMGIPRISWIGVDRIYLPEETLFDPYPLLLSPLLC
jgi:hypothetical protein